MGRGLSPVGREDPTWAVASTVGQGYPSAFGGAMTRPADSVTGRPNGRRSRSSLAGSVIGRPNGRRSGWSLTGSVTGRPNQGRSGSSFVRSVTGRPKGRRSGSSLVDSVTGRPKSGADLDSKPP
jgi:hypothetical protein